MSKQTHATQQTNPAVPPAHSVLFALRGTANAVEETAGVQINPSFELVRSGPLTVTYTPEVNLMFLYTRQDSTPLSAAALRGVSGVRYNASEGTISVQGGDEVHHRSSLVQSVNYFNFMATPSRHSPFQFGVRLALGLERLSDDTIRTVEDRPPPSTCPPGDIFCHPTTTTVDPTTRQVTTDSSRTTAFLRAGVRVNITFVKPLRLGVEALGQGNVRVAGSAVDSFSFFVRAPLTLTVPLSDSARFVAEVRGILNFVRNAEGVFETVPSVDGRVGVSYLFDL